MYKLLVVRSELKAMTDVASNIKSPILGTLVSIHSHYQVSSCVINPLIKFPNFRLLQLGVKLSSVS